MPATLKTFRAYTLFILSLGSAVCLQAAPRTFTSPDGRTLQAEIQSATADMVTLKLVNGPSLVTQINKFSTADQAFIAEWRKANPVTIRYDFLPTYTKEKTDSSKATINNVEVTTETWVCNVKMINRSGQTLDGVKVNYDVYFSQANGSQFVTRKQSGSTTLESIKHLQEITFKTSEVKLRTSKLEGGFYYIDGTRSRQKDSIEGVSLRIHHQGKMVFDWASSGVPKDRASPSTEGTQPR